MKLSNSKILFFVLSALCGLSNCLLELNDENFERLTQATSGSTTGIHMVFFYSPTCPYCQESLPFFEEVAKEIEENDSLNPFGFVLSKIENAKNPKLARRFNIKKVPTILIFRKGKLLYYFEERTKRDLLDFLDTEFLNVLPSRWQDIPEEVGFFQQIVEDTMNDFETITTNYVYGSAFVFLSGILIGSSVFFLSG